MALRRVAVGNLTIAVEVEGTGPVLVLLHGIGSNRLSWHAVIADLTRDHKVIAWDAPGYGDSTDPPEKHFQLAQYAAVLMEVLVQVLEDEQPHGVTLIGHSFGAMIALEVYRQFPGRLSRLILADATLGHGGKADVAQKESARLTAWRNSSARDFAAERVPRLLSREVKKDILARGVEIMSMLHRDGYEVAVHTLYDECQEDVLTTVRVPTLVLCGDQDVVTPVVLSEHIADCIPGAVLSLIENAGHLSYLEQPGMFCNQVRQFIGGR